MSNKKDKVTIARSDVVKILERMKEKTKKEFIRITTNQEKTPTLIGSKIGGTPYWKNIEDYPVSQDGEKLILLAQINLAELPENKLFPNTGLLQFFIAQDDLYGMDFDAQDNQDAFRVVYHKELDDSVTALEGIPTTKNLNEDKEAFPVEGEAVMEFFAASESINPLVYNFEEIFKETAKELGIMLPECNIIYDVLTDDDFETLCKGAEGHKLSGYPYFTQADPRDNYDSVEYYDTLLFQVDTEMNGDSPFNIMFGDSGIANFFIHGDDLKNGNFSRIMYNWDCC